jgi:hypothetical protein
MGGFLVNLHVKHEALKSVKAALQKLPGAVGYVTEPKQGWVSVYESGCSDQATDWIEEVTQFLSRETQSTAIACLIHDGDFLNYWLYDRGQLLDHYHSLPDYFQDVSEAEKKKVAGQPKKLLTACRLGVSLADVQALFAQDLWDPYDKLAVLAQVLGIDDHRSALDHGSFSTGTSAAELPAEAFGSAAAATASQPIVTVRAAPPILALDPLGAYIAKDIARRQREKAAKKAAKAKKSPKVSVRKKAVKTKATAKKSSIKKATKKSAAPGKAIKKQARGKKAPGKRKP